MQPEDPVARPAPPAPDPQEEEPARQPARPARRAEEAALVPAEGAADRAEAAGLRGRDGGHHGDDPGLRRAPRGERAVDSAPASWESVTVIAALGLDGVRAPLAFPGSTDTAAFQTYVEQVLVPALHEGDVVVFDNLKPHLTAGVAAAIERAGAGAAAAAVQPGLHADRGDVLEGQAGAPPGRGAGEGRTLRCPGGGAEASDPGGHPRLVPARRPVCNSWVNRCTSSNKPSPSGDRSYKVAFYLGSPIGLPPPKHRLLRARRSLRRTSRRIGCLARSAGANPFAVPPPNSPSLIFCHS